MHKIRSVHTPLGTVCSNTPTAITNIPSPHLTTAQSHELPGPLVRPRPAPRRLKQPQNPHAALINNLDLLRVLLPISNPLNDLPPLLPMLVSSHSRNLLSRRQGLFAGRKVRFLNRFPALYGCSSLGRERGWGDLDPVGFEGAGDKRVG